MFGGFPAGQQHPDRRLGKQRVQQTLISALLRATLEPSLDLTRHEERNPYLLRRTQLLRQFQNRRGTDR